MNDRIYYKVIRMPERMSVYAFGKYRFKYPKKGKIQCNNITLGFFMFEKLQQAEFFVEATEGLFAIIKVRCLAPVFKPPYVAALAFINEFYTGYRSSIPIHYPFKIVTAPVKGTVCCKYIEIL